MMSILAETKASNQEHQPNQGQTPELMTLLVRIVYGRYEHEGIFDDVDD